VRSPFKVSGNPSLSDASSAFSRPFGEASGGKEAPDNLSCPKSGLNRTEQRGYTVFVRERARISLSAATIVNKWIMTGVPSPLRSSFLSVKTSLGGQHDRTVQSQYFPVSPLHRYPAVANQRFACLPVARTQDQASLAAFFRAPTAYQWRHH